MCDIVRWDFKGHQPLAGQTGVHVCGPTHTAFGPLSHNICISQFSVCNMCVLYWARLCVCFMYAGTQSVCHDMTGQHETSLLSESTSFTPHCCVLATLWPPNTSYNNTSGDSADQTGIVCIVTLSSCWIRLIFC